MGTFVGVEEVAIEVRTNVVTDDLADVFIDVCADMMFEINVPDVRIIVVAADVIVLEFAVAVLATLLIGKLVGALTGVLPGGIVHGIGFGALPEMNANVLAAV